MDATRLYWRAKAKALTALGKRSMRMPVVRVLAATLALHGLSAAVAAERIREGVAARVEYRNERGDHFATADEVLRRGVDDCDGHAVVGAALGAAAGFAARIVGVSWPGEAQPGHVRAEISDDGRRWWPADSTPAPVNVRLAYHPPAAVIAERPAPAAVGLVGLPFEIPIVDDVVDVVVDAVGSIVGGLLDGLGLDDAADWLMGEVREVIEDPALGLLALGTLGTCVVSPPLCPAAVAVAKGLVVTEAVHRYGPDRWRQLAWDQVESAIDGTRRQMPGKVWSAGLREAQRQLISIAEGDELYALMTGREPGTDGSALARFPVARFEEPLPAAVVQQSRQARVNHLADLARAGIRPRPPAPSFAPLVWPAGAAGVLWWLWRMK